MALLLFMLGCSGGDDQKDQLGSLTECERVRERLVELKLANASAVDLDAHRTAMRAALGGGFIATCNAEFTAEQRSCVLDATDADAASACASTR